MYEYEIGDEFVTEEVNIKDLHSLETSGRMPKKLNNDE